MSNPTETKSAHIVVNIAGGGHYYGLFQVWNQDGNEISDEDEKRLLPILAAAPALLEASKRLLRAFEADKEQCPTLDILTSWETNSQAIANARAAIQLAEGK